MACYVHGPQSSNEGLLIPPYHTAGHAGYTVQGHVRGCEPGAGDQGRVPDQWPLHPHQRALPAMRVGAGLAVPRSTRQGARRCARTALGIARVCQTAGRLRICAEPHCLEGCPGLHCSCYLLQGNSDKVGGTLIRSSRLVLHEGEAPEPPSLYQPPEELPGAALACAF